MQQKQKINIDVDKAEDIKCEKCENKRKEIYIEKIYPAFSKLVENLIYIHGFCSDTLPYEILKNDCVNFLFESILKFDHNKGSKAFSYFNVVAKNWLIINSKKDMDILSPVTDENEM